MRELPPRDRAKVLSALKDMEVDPFEGDLKPLKPLRALFRRRMGDYRIIFAVDFERSEAVVFRISQRERAYEPF